MFRRFTSPSSPGRLRRLGLIAGLAWVAAAGAARAGDLSLTLDVSASNVGQSAYFSVWVRNESSGYFGMGGMGAPPTAVVVLDIPAIFTGPVVSAQGWSCGAPAATATGHRVTCLHGGVLAPHQQFAILRVDVMQSAVGHFHACAQVAIMGSGPGAVDFAPGNNSACRDGDILPPAHTCLRSSGPALGAPLIITGQGRGPSVAAAEVAADQDWRAKAAAHGAIYSNWANAQGKSDLCTSSAAAGRPSVACVRKAQPCT